MQKHYDSLYGQVIHKTRYARWNEVAGRREDFSETVDRYLNYFNTYLLKTRNYRVPYALNDELRAAMINLDIMPSMRALMTAGIALDSAPVAAYNCAYLPVDSIHAFSETAYVLMCGTGVGFSVEHENVNKLPDVPLEIVRGGETIVVPDSREGWCESIYALITALYAGQDRPTDTSLVRPAGSPLKTFGGFSSGPEPLDELFNHIRAIFYAARGTKLTPLDAFSIQCYIAQSIVVGGVRRSATICLFDPWDTQMLYAKSGAWYDDPARKHFAMANVSAVFEDDPDFDQVEKLWGALRTAGSGEPGIFNRAAAWRKCEEIGRRIRDEDGKLIKFGLNPCGEIILRPYQFCNLSGFCIRSSDTREDLKDKARLAAILGTWQSCIDEFPFLREIWSKNTKEERLLGVCPSGFMDHGVTQNTTHVSAYWLRSMRDAAIAANANYAHAIGIERSKSVTSVKPAGNSGQLYYVASGIHPWYSPYYIRTIRQSRNEPITAFLQANGIPNEVSVQNERDIVFSFPIKAPDGARCADDITALQQLEHCRMVRRHYSTHTVSCTIYVRPDEWDDVGDWVMEHFDDIVGISFLPYSDHTYQQAVYTPISESEYSEALEAMPKEIDWDLLVHFEKVDNTTVSHEFACVAGACERE